MHKLRTGENGVVFKSPLTSVGKGKVACHQEVKFRLDAPEPSMATCHQEVWSQSDGDALRDAVLRFGENWAAVAGCFEGKTEIECEKRWTATKNVHKKVRGRESQEGSLVY